MTSEEFRAIALGMRGAIERAHMNHPDFRVNGRIFATLHSTDQSGTVKLLPEEQLELMRLHPGVFTPATGAWGRQGWTNIRLASADAGAVRGAMMLACESVGEKPPRRPRVNRRR